jgi:hypothetical protein
MVKKIQEQLDNFIRGNTKRNWTSEDFIYTSKDKGGLGFFKLTYFIDAIKITWIRRYGMGTKDHWCDLMDYQLNLSGTDNFFWRMRISVSRNLFMPNYSPVHMRGSKSDHELLGWKVAGRVTATWMT